MILRIPNKYIFDLRVLMLIAESKYRDTHFDLSQYVLRKTWKKARKQESKRDVLKEYLNK